MKCKKFLTNILDRMLSPMRERRAEYEKDIPYVYEVLRAGTERAEQEAAKTLDEVKNAMRINYFSDEALIAAQSAKYAQK